MVTSSALLHGNKERLLTFNPQEHPIALQVGGSDPAALAECAKIAEDWGYDEINLNCGCPSDRVQEGKIGAILMREPQRVADCVMAMRQACGLEVTVKHRIGVDDMDDYGGLHAFVAAVAAAGCRRVIVHARKAWLKGLSPKENREVPPLNYPLVLRLKQAFPQLQVIINGGITALDQAEHLLVSMDGVMLGREAYQNPYLLAQVDNQLFFANQAGVSRAAVLAKFAEYCNQQIRDHGLPLHHMSRHVLGLYSGEYGARRFRRHITENARRSDATAEVLMEAAALTERI